MGHARLSRTRATVAATFVATMAAGLVVASEASATVYWANTGNLAIGNSLGRANVDGTSLTDPFVNTNEAPCGIATDDEYIYWTHRGEFPAGFVGRATLDGTEVDPEFIPTESAPCGVAVNDTHIFWANWQNGGSQGNSIGRANIDGTSPNQAFIDNVAVNGSVCGVEVDANFIYWGSRQTPGDIGRAPIGGGAADTDFIDDANYSCDVAVNATHVYWAEVSEFFGAGSIGRANIDGSSPNVDFIPNSSGVETPCGIDVDATHVFWGDLNAISDPGTDAVGRAELDGDPVEPDFIETSSPTCGVAVDALEVSASNQFRIVRVKRDRKRGKATVVVDLPGTGSLKLQGKGLRRARDERVGPGELELRAVPTGAVKRRLNDRGTARVRAKLTYAPAGGEPRTKGERIKLVKRG